MREYTVPGVPLLLAQDGWWFEPAGPEAPVRRSAGARAVGLLILLIALADFLFWRQAGPGLSLAIFLLALAAAVRLAAPPQKDWAALLMVLAVLPVVERVQLLSVYFAVGGVLVYAIWTNGQWVERRLSGILAQLLGLPRLLPLGVLDAWRGVRVLRGAARASGGLVRWARALALPLGLGLCFLSLLIAANPVLADWIDAAGWRLDPVRWLFWAGIALLIWPLLVLPEQTLRPLILHLPQWQFGGVVNAGAVRTSLWVFNAMFAVQTVMDARYLWGGATLPAGMTHAEYAHRGAYPLLLTALLAGGFAVIARVYAAESRVVRVLLLGWIGQNLALVASSLLRLQSYMEAYGLTYLRVSAAIWMALVAVGLVLVAWAVVRERGNAWLTLRCTALGAGVLYACCFVNFAGVIADYNLRAWHAGTLEAGLDRPYLCGLGQDAWAAFQKHGAGWNCDERFNPGWNGYPLDLMPPRIEGWRDWSYRSWRVLREADAYSDRG